MVHGKDNYTQLTNSWRLWGTNNYTKIIHFPVVFLHSYRLMWTKFTGHKTCPANTVTFISQHRRGSGQIITRKISRVHFFCCIFHHPNQFNQTTSPRKKNKILDLMCVYPLQEYFQVYISKRTKEKDVWESISFIRWCRGQDKVGYSAFKSRS